MVSTEEFKELQRIQKEVGAEMQLATISLDDNSEDVSNDFTSLQTMVEEVDISPTAADFIDSMEDMNYHEFVERVVTLLIKQKQPSINQLGFDQKTVNSMLGDYQDEQKVARQNNRKKKRR